jgi:hypothetical protein
LKRLGGVGGVPGFIACYCVSTDKQGASGLGLEDQQEAVERHVRAVGGHILDVFRKIESGNRNDRSQIAAAIAACRSRRAALVIAKLDRQVAATAPLRSARVIPCLQHVATSAQTMGRRCVTAMELPPTPGLADVPSANVRLGHWYAACRSPLRANRGRTLSNGRSTKCSVAIVMV